MALRHFLVQDLRASCRQIDCITISCDVTKKYFQRYSALLRKINMLFLAAA
nr:MAG TPA: hypothetical protein [Caudoviricetes sp.]